VICILWSNCLFLMYQIRSLRVHMGEVLLLLPSRAQTHDLDAVRSEVWGQKCTFLSHTHTNTLFLRYKVPRTLSLSSMCNLWNGECILALATCLFPLLALTRRLSCTESCVSHGWAGTSVCPWLCARHTLFCHTQGQ